MNKGSSPQHRLETCYRHPQTCFLLLPRGGQIRTATLHDDKPHLSSNKPINNR